MDSGELLKRKGLSVTEGRIRVLSFFLHSRGALSHSDIEARSGISMDRVTIYRTLQSFVEKGIIHQVPTTDNSVLYALCRHEDGPHDLHEDEHIHFICDECENTICLDGIMVPRVKLPRGFRPESSAMIVRGVCNSCRH